MIRVPRCHCHGLGSILDGKLGCSQKKKKEKESSLSSSIRKWERLNDNQLEGSSLPFFKDLHLRVWQWIPVLICMGRTSCVPGPLTWVPP